jgi:ABC-type transport system involved in multi-copper enzyme maturation permease subunit
VRDAIAAEWLKIRTVRSSAWTLGATLLLAAGLAWPLGASLRGTYLDDPERRAEFDPVFAGVLGLLVAQLALVTFAVLVVGAEYGSGTIRPSLLATPRRGRLFAAKAVVTALVAGAVAAVAVPASFLVAQAALGPLGIGVGDADAPRTLVGAWLYLTLMALFALGVATALRGTGRALGVLMPLLFLGAQGLGNVPGAGRVLQFLPDQAGAVVLHVAGPPDDPRYERAFGPWGGLAILAAWTALALAAGALTLRRRDA